MGRDDRSWEQRYTPDGEVSRSAASAIGLAFILVEVIALVVVGFTLTGLLVGFVTGIVAVVMLSKLVARSQRGVKGSPPPDLL